MTVKVGRGRSRRSISSAKRRRGQKVCSVVENDILRNSIDKDMHCERTGQMGAKKYLRKNCYHCIECFTTNSLAAFMWRRPLNNAVLVAPIHREPVGVSDGTSTQVVAWMIDKWRAKIIQREIYNVSDPWEKEEGEIERETM